MLKFSVGHGFTNNKIIIMKKILFLLSACIAVCNVALSQVYTNYYSNGEGVVAKIVPRNKIVDYHTHSINELLFYNSASTSYEVTGWVKLRYTELRTGKTEYTEKRLKKTVNSQVNYGSGVSTYFKPSWSRYGGYVDQEAFYIESCRPLRGGIYNSGASNSPIQKQYFSNTMVYTHSSSDYWQSTTFSPNGTCTTEASILDEGVWVRGDSRGTYYIAGQNIYITWDEWVNETGAFTDNSKSQYKLNYCCPIKP